jgi:hypothetical protein
MSICGRESSPRSDGQPLNAVSSHKKIFSVSGHGSPSVSDVRLSPKVFFLGIFLLFKLFFFNIINDCRNSSFIIFSSLIEKLHSFHYLSSSTLRRSAAAEVGEAIPFSTSRLSFSGSA